MPILTPQSGEVPTSHVLVQLLVSTLVYIQIVLFRPFFLPRSMNVTSEVAEK